jgi:predicted enzyme related to lactoylglutathione lyase
VDEGTRISALILRCSDVEQSARFYSGLVGLSFHAGKNNDAPGDRWLDGEHRSISFTEGGYFHFALFPSWNGEVTRATQISFPVPDLAKTHERALKNGAKVLHPPRDEPWGMVARYEDPDGNFVSLRQSKPRK